MRRTTRWLAAAGATVLVGGLTTGCASPADDADAPATTRASVSALGAQEPVDADQQALLEEYGLAGLTGQQIVDQLDRVPVAERSADLFASVRVDELLVTTEAGETAVALPEDSFYLSIAPYVDQTHECFYHSLTTCRGELGNADVHVTITDDATGELLVNETVTTFDNGFVGFWLPRDVAGTVAVTYDERTGEVPFSTDSEGATCLTTLQVA